MSQFVYYLPAFHGVQPTAEQLAEAGLAYAFEDPLAAHVTKGPSHDDQPGPPGVVLSEKRADLGPPRYLVDRQQWRELPGGKAWVGMLTAAPPGPRDLARRQQLSGHLVDLADGKPWHVPCARRWHDQGEADPVCLVDLPQAMEYDAGQWRLGGIKPRYRPLWALIERYTAACREACERAIAAGDQRTDVQFMFNELDTLAITALQLNYRVSHTELSLLGAYDQVSRKAVVDAVLDNSTFEALIKKKLYSTALAVGSG